MANTLSMLSNQPQTPPSPNFEQPNIKVQTSEVIVWNVQTGKDISICKEQADALSPDGKWIINMAVP